MTTEEWTLPNSRRHGVRSSYDYGCRCELCTRANTEAVMRYRRARGMQPQKYGRECGLIATYNAGCRCDECRRAARQKARQHRRRRQAERQGPFECLDCPATFTNQSGLTQHSEMMHFGRPW